LGSLSPGACPTSNTRPATARPTTLGRCIRGQRTHARRAARWASTAAIEGIKKERTQRPPPNLSS
jgi:hypothetical protein